VEGGAVSTDLSEGQAFGAYHIVEIAGSGGMGVVYRAEQRSLGRTVALKVIRSEIAERGDYRSRFLREARLAAAVDHPHVVSVFDVGEHAGRLYLAMQWVDGSELRALIDRYRRLDPDRTVRIGTQQALALHAVHAVGLVHRDVKPSNVLVRDIGGQDHSYLVDFGIAKMPAAQDDLTRTGLIMGTSGYLSPEQIRGEQPGPRSDLYALGCVVFEALAGKRPFAGENDLAVRWAHANSPRPVASALCPALGPRYDAFLARALAVDPRDRFSSGREFAEALESARNGRLVDQTQTPADDTQVRFRPSLQQPAIPETTSAYDARPSEAPEPTMPRRAEPPVTAAVPRAADAIAGPASASNAGRRSGPRPQAGRGGHAPRAARVGQLAVLAGGIVFLASVTVLNEYVNNGTGWKSLLEATHGDVASPLFPINFWVPIALLALVFVISAMSMTVYKRSLMISAAIASLGLVGYTLYIPTKGSSPGFGPYGSSYWLSAAAALAMVLGAVVAAVARSDSPSRVEPINRRR
jgi:serine/threonine protein kinase